jgi:DeoR/GlpR family transcriptional regulator of sugar metabolism
MRAIMGANLVSGTDRQLQIIQLVERQQRISVANICTTFNVSQATARRDRDTLASEGEVQRVHTWFNSTHTGQGALVMVATVLIISRS